MPSAHRHYCIYDCLRVTYERYAFYAWWFIDTPRVTSFITFIFIVKEHTMRIMSSLIGHFQNADAATGVTRNNEDWWMIIIFTFTLLSTRRQQYISSWVDMPIDGLMYRITATPADFTSLPSLLKRRSHSPDISRIQYFAKLIEQMPRFSRMAHFLSLTTKVSPSIDDLSFMALFALADLRLQFSPAFQYYSLIIYIFDDGWLICYCLRQRAVGAVVPILLYWAVCWSNFQGLSTYRIPKLIAFAEYCHHSLSPARPVKASHDDADTGYFRLI